MQQFIDPLLLSEWLRRVLQKRWHSLYGLYRHGVRNWCYSYRRWLRCQRRLEESDRFWSASRDGQDRYCGLGRRAGYVGRRSEGVSFTWPTTDGHHQAYGYSERQPASEGHEYPGLALPDVRGGFRVALLR